MKLFFSYLKSHCKTLFFAGTSVVIFCGIFALDNLPLSAVGYAALLSVCVGLVLIAADFLHFRKTHFQLLRLAKKVRYGLDGLPPAQNRIEADYQTVLQELYRGMTELVTDCDCSQRETEDYYTLWAHQIKTPISAMHILLQSDENENRSDLQDCLFQIEEYVEMVLSYVRLNSDNTDLVVKQYPLDSIIRQAIHKYAPLFIRRKIALHYQPVSFTVLTDEKWLLFVIEQILSNALKYTRSGGSVEIRLESGNTLIIADTGIGIAPEDLPRIGQKGFTGYNGRQDKKSTGLGLYLCRRILSKLSHTLKIESEVGKGTTVKIGLESTRLRVE